MSDAIKTILSGLTAFLRYFAPGFIALGLGVSLFATEPVVVLAQKLEILAIGAIVLGIILNSLHVALLEDLVALLVQQLWRIAYLKARLPDGMKSLCAIERFRAIEAQRM